MLGIDPHILEAMGFFQEKTIEEVIRKINCPGEFVIVRKQPKKRFMSEFTLKDGHLWWAKTGKSKMILGVESGFKTLCDLGVDHFFDQYKKGMLPPEGTIIRQNCYKEFIRPLVAVSVNQMTNNEATKVIFDEVKKHGTFGVFLPTPTLLLKA
jgi:hypothetical protein